MSKSCGMVAFASSRPSRVLRAALMLGLLVPVSTYPVFAQSGSAQQAQPSPIVGLWSTVFPREDGGTLHAYDEYRADGTWRMTSIVDGGTASGARLQVWGTYKAEQRPDKSYRIDFTATGHAPHTVCTEGAGCQKMPEIHNVSAVVRFIDADHLRIDEGMKATSERVAAIPPQLLSQVPETVSRAASSTDKPLCCGGDHDWPHRPPPRESVCDNLQQQRICTINDGTMYTGNDGCQHCSK